MNGVPGGWASIVKRGADIAGAAVLFVVMSPLMLACAVAVRLDSAGPVLFRQERLGAGGRIFLIHKLRTMVDGAEADPRGVLTQKNDPRITRVGRLLRMYRLDEWPQLVNVLKGDMSLVGPRPLLPAYLGRYTESDMKRVLARPGMTGWQQVNGGSTNTWEERVALDIFYVENWSLWLDLRILLRTPLAVIRADTVYGSDGWQRSGMPPERKSTP